MFIQNNNRKLYASLSHEGKGTWKQHLLQLYPHLDHIPIQRFQTQTQSQQNNIKKYYLDLNLLNYSKI